MASNSAATVMDTFKEILHDINDHCSETSGATSTVGSEVLCNKRNTMSDCAATEKAFNTLLENFRAEILPKINKSWNEMTEERALCKGITSLAPCICL